MGLTVDVKGLRAHRYRAQVSSEAVMGDILDGSPTPFSFLILPSVGEGTPPVRIYGPDGRLQEVVPATEFRRRTLEADRRLKHARQSHE